ncbi:hypothetical protein ACTXHK_20320 [Bacillus licheniformis]
MPTSVLFANLDQLPLLEIKQAGNFIDVFLFIQLDMLAQLKVLYINEKV